jgi:multicomponent Na+:H+ antiporter subunit G
MPHLPDFASLPANDIAAIVLIVGGIFFFFTSTVGLLRFPDLYSRMHATGKGDTLAVLLILCGAICHHGLNLNSAKLLLIAVFVFIANPTGTHALGRAAYRCGIRPWTRKDRNPAAACAKAENPESRPPANAEKE